ncbi:conserved hypothetical protein [Methylocella silvestris BL2]|uniref:Uncharacterized protein n=1 Tax=Methylocella silvestris (strain DSM 15510 / CIP 108128 / LMG 27833 / NCIMB 13906 / BL2) TaxID=395965 RepID=B8EJ42_METSB|nr:hypothetical protein [Methylocella silvestris]ACK52534.1 conserved hypothetical protein [Methylocella silvestris BL2]
MTSITETPFASLEAEGRLINAVFKGATEKPGRFGYRGGIALKFQQSYADEKRPPELACEQVIAVADAGAETIPFLTANFLSFEHLQSFADVLKGKLSPTGKYFAFCNNIDLLAKYHVEIDGIPFYVLPLDESTVYNEVLELLRLDKTDLKKLTIGGKTDAVADAALAFDDSFDAISFAQGLERMGPVKNRYEHRPV